MDHLTALDAAFAKDEDKENKGVWFNYGKHRFQIARACATNAAFRKLMDSEMKPYRALLRADSLEPIKDILPDVFKDVYSRTILVNWKVDGAPDVPYTADAGREAFDRLPDFWVWVQERAKEEDAFRRDAEDTDVKN